MHLILDFPKLDRNKGRYLPDPDKYKEKKGGLIRLLIVHKNSR